MRRSTDYINVVGIDPSLRNWGIAKGIFIPATGEIEIVHMEVIQSAASDKAKGVRQNCADLDVAQALSAATLKAVVGAQAVFAEVPHGSQSARSMASYGICVGVLGALRASGTTFYEVTAAEVKLATGLPKTATKDQMIEWAMAQHVDAPWPMQKIKGVESVVKSTAEHVADACAAIRAGIISKPFQQALALIKKPA